VGHKLGDSLMGLALSYQELTADTAYALGADIPARPIPRRADEVAFAITVVVAPADLDRETVEPRFLYVDGDVSLSAVYQMMAAPAGSRRVPPLAKFRPLRMPTSCGCWINDVQASFLVIGRCSLCAPL
jgi:hypothetical protein